MAEPGRLRRTVSLDGLVAQLHELDKQRQSVIDQIRGTTERLISGENPFRRQKRRAAAAIAGTTKTTGRRRRRKMSAAARAKISAAQKARWAKQKARK